MGKIFISYSSKNKELTEKFIEFLQLGMGIGREDIFCTVSAHTLKTGEPFIEAIRKELKDCEAVISLITEDYLNSKFCLIEAGAAWAMSKRYFPLLTVPFSDLAGTPLQGLQMRLLDDEEALSSIYDEMTEWGVVRKRQTAEFYKRMEQFVEYIRQLRGKNFNNY